MSQQQPISILKRFKDFFACKNVLALNYRYPQPQIIYILEIFKNFSPAKLSQPQIIDIPEIFKDFFGFKIILVATHQNSGNIEGLFGLQICLSRKSSISWNYSKTFSAAKLSQQQTIKNLKIFKDSFACKIVLAANHLYPGNIQRLFRLQNCLSRKSSIYWKYSKTFSTANLSQPQIIYILEIFKKFSPAKLSQPQIIDIPEIFKDFFGCKIVLVATHQNSGNIEGLFGLQICLSRKSSISW